MSPAGRYVLAFALLLLADLAYLAPALFTSDVRAPADVTPHWPPFRADLKDPPPPPKNELLNDWLVQFHPWRHLVADSWRAGRPPLWNERSGGGEPLLANLQCGALSPYLPIDLAAGDQASDWRQLAQLLVAQGLCLLLAAHLGLSAAAGAVVALAYGFSSFMQVWALHPHSASASFAPGILWALLRLTAAPSGWRFLVAAACVAFPVLAGHAETAAKSGIFAAAVVLLHDVIRAPAVGRARAAALVASAGACGLLLAACVLAPFFDYVSQSDARTARALYAGAGTPLAQLATLIDADWFGTALNPPTWRGAGHYPDGVVHIGVVALGLAALGLFAGFVRRPQVALPLVAAAGAAVMVACGPEGIRTAWAAIPVLSDIRPVRCLSLVILPLSVFAGFGLDALSAAAARLRGPQPSEAKVGVDLRGPQPSEAKVGVDLRGPQPSEAKVGVDLGPLPRRIGGALVLAAVAATSALPWRGFIPTAPVADLHPPSRALEALRAREASGRSIELGRLTPAGMGEIYGFSRLARYDAIGLRRLSQVFTPDGEAFPIFPNVSEMTFAPPAVLDALSVRWVLSAYPAEEARVPTKPWHVESNFGITSDLHAPGRQGPLPEIVIVRGFGQSLRDGTVEAVLRGPGLDCSWTLMPAGWTATGGEPPLPASSPAVEEFLATQLRGFNPEALAIPPKLAETAKTITFRLKGPGASFRVAALERGGVGKDVREVENQGWLRISERTSALPFAYLAAGIRPAGTEAEALGMVRAPGFDPRAQTVVEAPAGTELPADAAFQSADGVTRRPWPGRIEVEVRASAPRLLVVSEAFARGWRAAVDGVETEVYPANVTGMALRVPAGDHRVELVFRPLSFLAGCAISAGTLVALLGAAAFIRGRKSARGQPPEAAR